MVKNLPCNAGNTGSIPRWRPRIPHAAEQISRHTTITEPVGHNTPYIREFEVSSVSRLGPGLGSGGLWGWIGESSVWPVF